MEHSASHRQDRVRLNPVSLILLKIIVMGLIGIPFAYVFDRNGYVTYFIGRLSSEKYISAAYFFSFYAFLVIAFLYYGLGLRRKMTFYIHKTYEPLSITHYHVLWLLTFVLSLGCFVFIFIQSGFQHPALAAIRADYMGVKIIRQTVSQTVNMNVYNLGFKFFLPVNTILAVLILKKRLLVLSSLGLFILMSTFVLEKGPIVSTIILIIFFRMLLSKIPLKRLLSYALLALCLISLMYFLTRFATNLSTLASNISRRIFYGQISDLPYYFDLFSEQKIPSRALLPPYVSGLLGLESSESASRLVMEYTNPDAVAQGIAGVANSFFVGEAYAVAGPLGVLVSPLLVMANLAFCVYVFAALKKNFYFVFLFSWFLFKFSDGIFGGISYFTFSGLHLILILLFYYLLSQTFVKWAKKGKAGGLSHA